MERNEKAPAVESEGQHDGTDHPEVYPDWNGGVNDPVVQRRLFEIAVDRHLSQGIALMLTQRTCKDCGDPPSAGIRVAYRKDEDAILCDVCYAQRRFDALNRLERVTGDE